jgi:hypothetical protein
MEILKQKNVDLMMFSGKTMELVKEGEIETIESEDGS